uniref:Uncharacterized protein n=1 Tax=Arundo donax TaxID=35708 RepID=A0A0A9D8M2_ARUDO
MVPPRDQARREAPPRRDHALRLARNPGRRGVPGRLALRRARRGRPGGRRVHARQGILLAKARVPPRRRHRGAGPRAARHLAPHERLRQAAARRAGAAHASRRTSGNAQPDLERGVHVRRLRAL